MSIKPKLKLLLFDKNVQCRPNQWAKIQKSISSIYFFSSIKYPVPKVPYALKGQKG